MSEELPGIEDEPLEEKKKRKPIPIEKTALARAYSFAKALAFGTKVSAEQVKKRLEICSECPLVEINDKGHLNCGICGCSVGPNNKALKNLAAYEEKPGKNGYGCFYYADETLDLPERSKWAREGL